MGGHIRIGMLTPSSNTVLEPVTQAMVAGLPQVSVHFSRFKVKEISLSQAALAQFNDAAILQAAELLADAKVDVIGWNGTSSSWLGFDADLRLCTRIEAATGIKATTSILALNEILQRKGIRKLGLFSPYRSDVQAKIVSNYATIGISCSPEKHLGIEDNFTFAEVSGDKIVSMVHEAAAGPEAIAIICTNLRAAPLVERLESEIKLPVYDTIATVVWKCLCLAGVNPGQVSGWGSLFRELK